VNPLKIDFLGITFPNPVIIASGPFNFGREYAHLYPLSSLGAVTTPSIYHRALDGYPTPRITETPMGMLNAIGPENKGVDAYVADELPWLKKQGARVIVNICGEKPADFAYVAKKVVPFASMIEVNLACPSSNGQSLSAHDAQLAAEIIALVKSVTCLPVLAKLSPNDFLLPIAKALEEAGVDGYSLINPLPGMRIDIERKRPVLSKRQGGLSGPAIKPVAISMINKLYQHTRLPILGMGGISNHEDALEFALAGSRLIAVGTALFADPYIPIKIIQALQKYFLTQNETWRSWVGLATPH